MSQIPIHFQIPLRPSANPDAVIIAGNTRFTLLTSRLIRMEYAANGRFQDQASQAFWYREQPVPFFQSRQSGNHLEIETDHLHLRYHSGKPFSADTLTITLKETGTTWQYGDVDTENLLGTTRTLDTISGSTALEPGLMSQAGWVVVDDSQSLVFNEEGWLEPRESEAGSADLYFFGYGRDYTACLRDYCLLTGPVPLLPRWALGNWWSRYWPYTQDELTNLMREFREHGVPLSVCIVDMDWHLVDVGPEYNGWTGYTWNRELFPDPKGFIAWLHEQGLKTALNLHPALGVRPYEAMYPQMAKRLGLDPATNKTIPFDIANPDFTQAYFEVLHHPQEADGVDFWWMDWQQGEVSGLPGLDPLWWLNHLHFYDLGRDGRKRPFVFSRWGGLGNHRYPIGFSGDTHVDWESLAFQPYFTATAANVGFSWWSHDIGGHMFGVEEGELFTRWVQFGVFSPIFRLHSTQNVFHERRPWGYDAEVYRITKAAMQLRHALIPYLYTMSWRNYQEHQPPFRPMYHDYPHEEAAYTCPQQYTVGTELIAAPFTSPADADTRLSRQVIWLPPGDWYHFFTGEHYQGNKWIVQYGSLEEIPVFAKAGAIVPLGPKVGWGGIGNPALLDLHIFAGADNTFTLYEDDGESTTFQKGAFGLTTIKQRWRASEMVVEFTTDVSAVSDQNTLIPNPRQYRLHIHGIKEPETLSIQLDGQSIEVENSYDVNAETVHLSDISLMNTVHLTITLATDDDTLLSRRNRLEETCRAMLHAFKLETSVKAAIAAQLDQLQTEPAVLNRFGTYLAPTHIQALIEVTQQAGVHRIQQMREPELLLLWNNLEQPGMRYQWSEVNPRKWPPDKRYRAEGGISPRFKAMTPTTTWQLSVNYFDLTRVVFTNK